MRNVLLTGLILWTTAFAASSQNHHQVTQFTISLNGTNEVPPSTSPIIGNGFAAIVDGNVLAVVVGGFSGPFSPTNAFVPTNVAIYGPAKQGHNGKLIANLAWAGISPPEGVVYGAGFEATPSEMAQLRAGLWYVNVKSEKFPDGEIRGQILPISGKRMVANRKIKY
jgi:hypothetical protein